MNQMEFFSKIDKNMNLDLFLALFSVKKDKDMAHEAHFLHTFKSCSNELTK